MSKVTKRVVGMEIISPGSPPDIDSDFSTVSKDRAYDYVSDLYGHDNVSHIVTFNTLGAKSAFKRMCTIYSIPFSQANRIAGMMPEGVEGHKITFNDIYDEKSDYYEDAADFRAATSGSEWLPIIIGARSIANKVQGTGVHACGVIISNKPLTDTIPLMVDSKDGKVTTQWSYQECEALGLIKMDFLGLDTVDLIQHTVQFIQRSGKEPPNMTEIIHGKMDDEDTYRLFQHGETIGVFQFGSEMVRGLLKHMKPTEFNDLAACTAVARPGPMGMNSHTMYADRKNNLAPVEPIHPDFVGSPLEEILGGTYGLCVPAGTLIEDSTTGRRVPIESFTEGRRTPSWDPDTGNVVHSPVFKVIHTGMQDVVKVCTWDGWETTVGVDHEMLTPSGFVKAGELTTHDSVGVISQGRLRWDRVTALEAAGVVDCYDLDVDDTHTYLVDGFVTHNCVYQEQIMQLAQRIAGMSLQEGDKLRKAMGKKKADVMAKMKPRFIQGGVDNGYSEEAMNKLWDILEPFAKYAFNKSHSVAYAMNAYQAAYLKTHYPVEFMSALVAQTISDRDKTLNNLREARRMGLTMGTVDINLSEVRMAPDYSGESPFEILYGISGVKSVSEDTARLIVAERERGGRFTSVYDAVTRCVAAGVNNKTMLVNLALAGAFDGLEPNRRRVVEAIPALLSVGRDESSKGMSLLAALDVPGEDIFMMPDVEDYSYTDRLGMEADMVGLYLSSHPMDHADLSPFGATPLKAVASAASGFGSGTARVVAAVSGIEMRTTGRGKMCTLHLDDGDGFLSVRLSPKVISGVEKFEAMEDIKARFCKGEMEVPKSTVAKALKDVPVVETIRQNMVYVMDVTYRRMFGGGQGSVRVDSIRPVTFTHDGGLPVRVRINVDRLGVDRARKAYVAIPRMLAEKTPGSTPIMIAHYRPGDGTVTSDEDRCRYALEVMRREKAAAGSSDDTRKNNKKSSRHDTGGGGGKTPSLLGDDNGHDESETEPRVKDQVGRRWPTEVPGEFIKDSEAGVEDMRSFADTLEYRDTGLTVAPSTDASRILEKYLGHENYDFGMYVPVVTYS